MNLQKLERYLRVNLLGPGPRLIKKAARLRYTQAYFNQQISCSFTDL